MKIDFFTLEGFEKGYKQGVRETYEKIFLYLNDAALAQNQKCHECTLELMQIIEKMMERDIKEIERNAE